MPPIYFQRWETKNILIQEYFQWMFILVPKITICLHTFQKEVETDVLDELIYKIIFYLKQNGDNKNRKEFGEKY